MLVPPRYFELLHEGPQWPLKAGLNLPQTRENYPYKVVEKLDSESSVAPGSENCGKDQVAVRCRGSLSIDNNAPKRKIDIGSSAV